MNLWKKLEPPREVKIRDKETLYEVLETDDPQDLLAIGHEIQGSCLDTHTTPNTNKCLLSYLIDGEIDLSSSARKKMAP